MTAKHSSFFFQLFLFCCAVKENKGNTCTKSKFMLACSNLCTTAYFYDNITHIDVTGNSTEKINLICLGYFPSVEVIIFLFAIKKNHSIFSLNFINHVVYNLINYSHYYRRFESFLLGSALVILRPILSI
jgi:hypothetical protein